MDAPAMRKKKLAKTRGKVKILRKIEKREIRKREKVVPAQLHRLLQD